MPSNPEGGMPIPLPDPMDQTHDVLSELYVPVIMHRVRANWPQGLVYDEQIAASAAVRMLQDVQSERSMELSVHPEAEGLTELKIARLVSKVVTKVMALLVPGEQKRMKTA